jgi:insertion element IS1 protein InsB
LTKDEVNKFEDLEVEIHFEGDMDEFWSFVQNRSNQRWTWYAIERMYISLAQRKKAG